MRKITWGLLAVAILYSGYWFVAARASEHGIKTWLEARVSEGWQSEYATLKTRGYPLTFETTLTDVALADPATGLAYRTPSISIKSRSFTPTRLHAELAQDLRLSTPFQHIDISNTAANGTLFVEVGTALTMHRATFNFDDLVAKSTLGWGFSLGNATAKAQRLKDDTLTHDIQVTLTNLAPSTAMMKRLNPNGILSDRFDTLSVDASVTFNKDWDITALEGPRPQPTHVLLRNMAATWGALDLRIAGDFEVDVQGVPTGKIALKATNWREMITLATAAGIIPKNFENMALRGGEMLAGMTGNANTIDAELTLSRGSISLGFLPLGPAPRIRIR
ncbi:DUF2125 domain-containing protein [Pacificibacter marinus]|uniref:DUF2125 domain-containing protein n=1 Tax=Pacificibacter marinus TaxID=658057 RepID=UPI001C06AC2A|nr:DUF2125 domain-containing protein [Pacificibacter marinus]MBU2868106.1 DUF2125 domain-containing protein [Pacificibacter marinus]